MPKTVEELAAEWGGLNEIVQTVTLECTLVMTREQIVAALKPEREGARIVLPREHPLDAFALEDGPQGPIPEVVRFKDFVWQGGDDSWRVKPLQRFATHTKGRARFVLVNAEGDIAAYEIENGKLYVCDVALAFARRADEDESRVGLKLMKATPLLRAGIAIGQRSVGEAA